MCGEALKRLYQYTQHCTDEDCVSDELAVLIGGRREVPLNVGGFKILADVVDGMNAYELKLDAEPYEGIGQAILYRAAGFKAHLVHVLHNKSHLFELYVNLYEGLSLDFCVHVLTKGGRYWGRCPW